MRASDAVHRTSVVHDGAETGREPLSRLVHGGARASLATNANARRGGQAVFKVMAVVCRAHADSLFFGLALRSDSPFRAILWALCTMRSRIASASVGSDSHSCQAEIGSWLVISVALVPTRSSSNSSRSLRSPLPSGAMAKSSRIRAAPGVARRGVIQPPCWRRRPRVHATCRPGAGRAAAPMWVR